MVVGDALALGVLLHGAEQAAAPAIAADAFVDPEPVDVQPAPLDVGDDAAVYLALFILDKAGDPLAPKFVQLRACLAYVVARQANAQRFNIIVLRRLGWGGLHMGSCGMGCGGVKGLKQYPFGLCLVKCSGRSPPACMAWRPVNGPCNFHPPLHHPRVRRRLFGLVFMRFDSRQPS